MNTKDIIIATALFSTTILACDEGSPEPEMELNVVEEVDPEASVDAPEAAENLPFAEVELSDGHQLRFFVLPDGGIITEESAQSHEIQPILRRDLSPLEVYWQWTEDDQEIPTELLTNYETYVGELDEFFDSAAPRGSGQMAAADEIAAPPQAPQEAKWWPESCPAPTDYNFIDCEDSYVGTSAQAHFMRIDGPMLYTIMRDTLDTNRDVKLYYKSTVGGSCAWTSYHQIATGSWALHSYTGSLNWSWKAMIAGGCGAGPCRYFRSIFQYDATQSSTCLPGIG